jgi:hypothetical protein
MTFRLVRALLPEPVAGRWTARGSRPGFRDRRPWPSNSPSTPPPTTVERDRASTQVTLSTITVFRGVSDDCTATRFDGDVIAVGAPVLRAPGGIEGGRHGATEVFRQYPLRPSPAANRVMVAPQKSPSGRVSK